MAAWNVTAVVRTNFIIHLQDKLPFQNKDTAEISLAAVQFSQQTLDLERKNNINKKLKRSASYKTVVFSLVTGGALRDQTKNGCEGDYVQEDVIETGTMCIFNFWRWTQHPTV